MKPTSLRKLESKGFTVGSIKEFLDLTPLEELKIEMLVTKSSLLNDESKIAKIFAGRIEEWVQVLDDIAVKNEKK
ncbi:hypothetical protein LCGC14_0869410 [marine sediment metagenome]|uniref:Uncharacterized protein n=1 Tax=marine sediment metagenome TaxID=412755 RepID=A0A0F9P545_9ZZZZ